MADSVDLTYSGPVGVLLESLVQSRTEVTLARACRSVREGNLTPEQALAVIAQIASLRLLLDDLSARFKAQ